jgi:hypothetical protein
MSSISYQSFSPKREVLFTPRTTDKDPSAWVVTAIPDADKVFQDDLYTPGTGAPLLVRTVRAEGLAADVVADMWSRYIELRDAVAENPRARWQAWAAGKLAARGAIEAPAVIQSQMILTELAGEKAVLASEKRDLHPVAAAMEKFLYGQVQLISLNGSTPKPELLPPVTYSNPAEIVGMVALDLAQQPEVAEVS